MERESDHGIATTPTVSSLSSFNKCPRSTSTILTPTQCLKRAPLREAVLNLTSSPSLTSRRLSYQCMTEGRTSSQVKWMNVEVKALIKFVLFHSTGDTWPSHKQMMFWTSVGEFVKTRSGSDTCRNGMPVVDYIYDL